MSRWLSTIAPAIALFFIVILAHPAVADQFTVLHTFSSGSNGSPPFAGVDGEPAGGLTPVGSTLYGTTLFAGANGHGMIYSLNRDGSNFQVVHSFLTATDGGSPAADMTLVGSTLYGTAIGGGPNFGPNGGGTVFSMNSDGSNFRVVHGFSGADGSAPFAPLTLVGSTLYGTTRGGGLNGGGTVFSVNPDGSNFQLEHSFFTTGVPDGPYLGSGGTSPFGGLTLVGSTLYGTTASGGASNGGTIFSVNLDGSNFQVIHSFSGVSDTVPKASLILVGSTLYGTTAGAAQLVGGAVFSINPDGSNFHVVAGLGGVDGAMPEAGLTVVGSTLYGTAASGGNLHAGTVFSVNTDGSNLRLVHAFSVSGSDGFSPATDLTLVGSTLYGTTAGGGSIRDSGTVFAISVPEPSSIVLAALGFVSLIAWAWRCRKRA